MLTPERRLRAERFFAWNLRPSVFNPQPRPHWIGDSDTFWYLHESPSGTTYRIVDAATGAWREQAERPEPEPAEAPNPLFARGHNLWFRDPATGAERALTVDGVAHHAWAKSPDSNLTTVTLRRRGITLPPNALLSPDGTKVFTSRLDEREVLDLPLVQHVPPSGARPVLHNMKFALSGDAHLPMERHAVIDLASGAVVLADAGPHVTGMTTCIEKEEAWWSPDSRLVWFLDRDRAWQRLTLHELDVATGAVRAVFSETSKTFTDNNVSVLGLPNVRILPSLGAFIWFSQESGWGHLYLHDLASGARRGAITAGEWLVRDLLHVDEAAGFVEFLAGGLVAGAIPTHRTLCRVNLDGSGLAVLTPGVRDQGLGMPLKRVPRDHIRPAMDVGRYRAPSGRYFVHTSADLESLPVTQIRRADGSLVSTLVTCETAEPMPFARPFTCLAADGVTTLYGALWLPSDFDPAKKYPVIDYIYPGPQRGMTPTVLLTDIMGELGRATMPQAFAELGFIVLNVDGRGVPLRDKAFHDFSYGRLDNPGTLEDHVATLRQLAERHAWFDISRVGIMGHSGGGYASVRALLDYPDDFHVAVATSGNHDQMGYSFAWTEKYLGTVRPLDNRTTNFTTAANPPFADRLKGKLLLATGDMDDNVHPALTMQLAAALIAADKDFEFIPLPNDDHTTVWAKPYFLRRAMEFMVRELGA